MTDNPMDARPDRAVPLDEAESDEDITVRVSGMVLDILYREDMTSEDLYKTTLLYRLSPEEWFLIPVAWFSAAYVHNLAKHASDKTIDLVKRLHVRWGRRTGESRLGVDGPPAATIIVTEDLPDEARLAFLDLDVTAPDLRGKDLRWDTASSAWLPDAQED
jgi:hypothetical protein